MPVDASWAKIVVVVSCWCLDQSFLKGVSLLVMQSDWVFLLHV